MNVASKGRWWVSLLILGVFAVALGCTAEEGSEQNDTVHGAEVAQDGLSPDGASETELDEASGPMRVLVVFDTLGFTEVGEDGTVPGFNLDGVVSGEDDETTCGQPDHISPEGVEGIDNQLAELVPLFELFGIGAAAAYIQSAIEEGGLLILLQVDGVDDLENDDEVTVMVRTGAGEPLLGTDGKLLSGQTFHLHEETPDSFAQTAYIEDGVLHAGPFDARLPVVVLGMQYELTFYGTLLRAKWTYDGGLQEGLLGGAATLDDLYGIGETAAADDKSVLPAIKAVVEGAGDLAPDDEGNCQRVSAAMAFTGVSAFYFPDEPGVEPPESTR